MTEFLQSLSIPAFVMMWVGLFVLVAKNTKAVARAYAILGAVMFAASVVLRFCEVIR